MQAQQYIPWLGSIVLQIVLIPVMLRQGMHRKFPVFFSYVVFDLSRELLVPLIAYLSPNQFAYFYSYWISIPIEYSLTFLVILEIFSYIFRSHIKYSPGTVRLLVILTLALFVLSVTLIVFPDIPINTLPGIILTANRSASLLVSGLLCFMWIFSKNLGLSFRHHVWGIVLGLGLYSSVILVAAAIHATTGKMCPGWITPLTHFAYLAATGIWTVYLWREEPQREPLTVEDLNVYRNLLDACRTIVSDVRKAMR